MSSTPSIWRTLTKEQLENLLDSHTSISAIMSSNGYAVTGTSRKILLSVMREKGIDVDEYVKLSHKRKKKLEPVPLDEILVEQSSYGRKELKSRLIKAGLLINECYVCKLGPVWNDKPLTLQIDHINGIRDDNRLENLRILCPNCHTQTSTHGSKRKKRTYNCSNCGDSITKYSVTGMCISCSQRTVIRPPKEELSRLLKNNTYAGLGRFYGVADNTVRKWAKRYGLI